MRAIVKEREETNGNGNGVASTEESSPTRQGGPNDENLETQESILSEIRKTREERTRRPSGINRAKIWTLTLV